MNQLPLKLLKIVMLLCWKKLINFICVVCVWIEMRKMVVVSVDVFYANFSQKHISVLPPQLWFTATLNVNIQFHRHICLHLCTVSYKVSYRDLNGTFLILYKIIYLNTYLISVHSVYISIYIFYLLKSSFKVNPYYRP